MKQLLALRKLLKGKKPTFTRHDAHKKKRVGTGWRRPKGRQNKMRLHKKGYAKIRSTGYGSPVEVKGLSAQGLTQNVVANLKDFTSLDSKKDGVIIASTVGGRKRLVLIDFVEKNNFTILNFNIDVAKEKIKENLAVKKAHKKDILKRKESKKAKEQLAKDKAKAEAKKEESDNKKVDKQLAEKDVDDSQVNKDVKLEEKKEYDKVLIRTE